MLELWARGGCGFLEVDGDGEAFPEEGVLDYDHVRTAMPGSSASAAQEKRGGGWSMASICWRMFVVELCGWDFTKARGWFFVGAREVQLETLNGEGATEIVQRGKDRKETARSLKE